MKWNPKSSWNDNSFRGRARFDEFKSCYPEAVFMNESDLEVPISSAESWNEVKEMLGLKISHNPHTANVKIKMSGQIFQYTEIERPYVKRVGLHAQNMENLVGISALNCVDSWSGFAYADYNKIIEEVGGVTRSDINQILQSCKSPDYGDNFIKIGKIAKTQIDFHPESYYMAPKTEWNHYKKRMAIKINEEHNIKIREDKWNPADILLVRKGSSIPYVSDGFTLDQENVNFSNRVYTKDLIPLSIKADDTCILGCRGIAKELTQHEPELSILEIAKVGMIEDIPVVLHCNFRSTPDNNIVQKLTLDWIIRRGIKHVEHTAELASGHFKHSGCWYIATNTKCVMHARKTLKLRRIIVSLSNNVVWFDFGEDQFCVRTKGAGARTLSFEHMGRPPTIREISATEIPENYKHMMN